ncbi:MAG: DUF6804 family protein [Microbacteriaceae bacterium]
MAAAPGRYPTAPTFRRPALAPGILGAIALMIGPIWLDLDAFTIVLYVVSILAVIMLVFAAQSTLRVLTIPLALIAIAWNPVYPFDFGGPWWLAAQFVAALAMVLAGVFIKVLIPAEDRGR